jgi:cytoskeletal protein CcmA (bactofilin family)
MTDDTSNETKDETTEPPAPEVLRSQADDESSNLETTTASTTSKPRIQLHRGTYRPSHKATFIGLAVVVMILAINAIVIIFMMKNQQKTTSEASKAEVTISTDVLDTLGVSRNTVGSSETELIVNPKSTFNGKVTVNNDVSVAGQVSLNGKLSGADASFSKLEAGNTSLSQLNVNGDATMSNLNLRRDLVVVGTTRLQGVVTISQLLTVNNSLNVSGNLAVGGLLSTREFQASSLTSDTTLTIGGHIITRGSAPAVRSGSAVGSNGTVSISGNDASGTVVANVGTGGGNGILAYITFINQYGNVPHVVITAVDRSAGNVYINHSSTGFNIGVNGSLSPDGYIFDYIVMQ